MKIPQFSFSRSNLWLVRLLLKLRPASKIPKDISIENTAIPCLDGQAKIRLLGLPDKVTALEKEITSQDQTVSFALTVDSKCAAGSFKNLFCAVDVVQNGQVIPHHIAAGGILRILPDKREPGKLAVASGRK